MHLFVYFVYVIPVFLPSSWCLVHVFILYTLFLSFSLPLGVSCMCLFCIRYSCLFPFLLVSRACVYFVYVIPVFFPSSWCFVHVFILYTLFLSFSLPLGDLCICLFCIRYSCLFPFFLVPRAFVCLFCIRYSCLFPFLLVPRAFVYFVYVIPVFFHSSWCHRFASVFDRGTSWTFRLTFEPPPDKTNKMTVRPAKSQISLGIRLV